MTMGDWFSQVQPCSSRRARGSRSGSAACWPADLTGPPGGEPACAHLVQGVVLARFRGGAMWPAAFPDDHGGIEGDPNGSTLAPSRNPVEQQPHRFAAD